MLTLQQTSALSNHRPTGFDYLRVLLAVCIVAWHSVSIVYGDKYVGDFVPLRPLILFLVPSFFALSGFLVSGSLFRTNHLPTFLTLRVIRIFPALCCEVVISALIIGAALTTLPIQEYLAHPMVHDYFLNVLGIIHYTLPGVFTANQTDSVNGQLWTIPFELECYIAIAILYLLTLHRRPRVFVVVLAVLTVLATARGFTRDLGEYNFRPTGRSVVWAFLWGVALYALREKIRHNKFILIASIAFAWLMLQWREGEYLAAPAIAYITVYIGLIDFKKSFVLFASDISYGIYLYGFAVQQAVYQVLPNFRTWHENFVISLAISMVFGYLSWTFIESKVMNRKNDAIQFVNSFTDRVSSIVRSIFGVRQR
ncbi:acyltransferase 3 [Janthinobacterium sp. HH01]|uniref:acyltransferase family protein n=1 Tax=Janthinobacterium sp. HH01 TaxID=1198452 RepID=UPI0002AEAB80|nr:acyltransferase [Janthinobacterium sp. HH01]ELX08031.1 acyltransferase 3 [Janthinobacterium sp. HH01]